MDKYGQIWIECGLNYLICFKVENDRTDKDAPHVGASFCIAMKDYAKAFYKSMAWKRTQEAYKASVGGLCERCLERGQYTAGVIVHHKIHITPENISDPSIALDWNNLELVCRDCHAALHSTRATRWKVDKMGRVCACG